MSDPREAQREPDLHDLFVARGEFAAAFEDVPDEALGYRGASDAYALSGIVVHITATLDHYRRVVGGMVDREFAAFALQPQDPGVEAAHAARCKTGFGAGERDEAFALLESAHDDVAAAVLRLEPQDYTRKVPVTYKPGEAPYDTSARDIVGWLTEHYREHVAQIEQLKAAAAKG
ncbi:MAG TPA: DinB family protein [Candidatus Limnocylindria bacterium]|nr:DinB family protein [Candidatus Limnocylindria bacterium]